MRDTACSIGLCSKLCASGFGNITGHRVAFRPAHLLAAEGGGGLLEYDIQPNALRDALGTEPLPIKQGHYQISDRPGLGIEPRPEVLNTWCQAVIPLDLAD